ncbi:probable membrane-associated kinase regulator 1 [Aristolochia californica]|uniref:probable membrane-associated kinase regulator 1 n=1 Tax=Aristolochia californica TaxID=171875 RepID=UPI0035D990A4
MELERGEAMMAKSTDKRDPNLNLFSLSSAPSSDFEFTVSLSPTSNKPSHLCPADELFYKGQLLPLHISPRLDMVRTLLASSSSSSSSDSNTIGSRDSNGSSNDSSSFNSDILLLNDCDSSRPSSATDDEDFKKQPTSHTKRSKYFSLSLFSSVFLRKEKSNSNSNSVSPTKKIGSSAKEVIKKYVKMVKPLYGRLSPKNPTAVGSSFLVKAERPSREIRMDCHHSGATNLIEDVRGCYRHSSFSGNLNLRCPRQSRSFAVSCPSSMRSSPSHSGVLRPGHYSDSSSSMEELQSAIQGAIAHCKNSMAQGTLKKSAVAGH